MIYFITDKEALLRSIGLIKPYVIEKHIADDCYGDVHQALDAVQIHRQWYAFVTAKDHSFVTPHDSWIAFITERGYGRINVNNPNLTAQKHWWPEGIIMQLIRGKKDGVTVFYRDPKVLANSGTHVSKLDATLHSRGEAYEIANRLVAEQGWTDIERLDPTTLV